jgi:hypothetical protein
LSQLHRLYSSVSQTMALSIIHIPPFWRRCPAWGQVVGNYSFVLLEVDFTSCCLRTKCGWWWAFHSVKDIEYKFELKSLRYQKQCFKKYFGKFCSKLWKTCLFKRNCWWPNIKFFMKKNHLILHQVPIDTQQYTQGCLITFICTF